LCFIHRRSGKFLKDVQYSDNFSHTSFGSLGLSRAKQLWFKTIKKNLPTGFCLLLALESSSAIDLSSFNEACLAQDRELELE
jgi:hypothetical protein